MLVTDGQYDVCRDMTIMLTDLDAFPRAVCMKHVHTPECDTRRRSSIRLCIRIELSGEYVWWIDTPCEWLFVTWYDRSVTISNMRNIVETTK